MKKLLYGFLCVAMLFAVCSCSDKAEFSLSGETAETSAPDSTEQNEANQEFTSFDLDSSVPEDATVVTFSEDAAIAPGTVSGAGASFNGNVLYVTAGGSYVLSGVLNGSVHVNASGNEEVRLILFGASIYSEDSPAIYIESADRVCVTLAQETENLLSDGLFYAADTESGPNGCLYSKDDLTINGSGALTVKGNCRNGIVSKDDLKIADGVITVSACKNAVKGKDSVVIGGGSLTVTAAIDGIKSDNETTAGKGVILITGGTIDISCEDDGLQAITSVTANGGTVTVSAKDNTINCDGEINISDGVLNEK